jgi:hypothetical protein
MRILATVPLGDRLGGAEAMRSLWPARRGPRPHVWAGDLVGSRRFRPGGAGSIAARPCSQQSGSAAIRRRPRKRRQDRSHGVRRSSWVPVRRFPTRARRRRRLSFRRILRSSGWWGASSRGRGRIDCCVPSGPARSPMSPPQTVLRQLYKARAVDREGRGARPTAVRVVAGV